MNERGNASNQENYSAEAYAQAKALPMDFLRGLGVTTQQANGRFAAVAIPYRDAEGRAFRTRYRTSEGFRWGAGTDLIPYGLDRLAQTDPSKAVILVEGESDAQTLWHHGLPALGIPGAGSWRSEWVKLLAGRKIYAWRGHDAGGEQFIEKLAADLPGVLVIQAPEGIKDPNELHQRDPSGFREAFVGLLAEAAPVAGVEPPTPHSTDGWLVLMSDVRPEPVRWLWPRRIPLGKLTMLDGDPGLGKSTLTLDIAARLSTGREMPDGTTADLEHPAGTVFLAAEDGLEDTVRPRLDVAEADCRRVAVLKFVRGEDGERRWPDVMDVSAIERAVQTVNARLLVVDPLVAYLPGDSHRDQDVRAALGDLVEMADRLEVAVVAVRHLRKSSAERAIYRGGGSIGLIAAARSGLLVAQDPSDPTGETRVLVSTKANLAIPAPGLTFALHEVQHPTQAKVACVVWGAETAATAEEVLATSSGRDRTALEGAVTFLREELKDGPVPSTELFQRASRQLGICKDTLRRAQKELRVDARREGFGAGGKWLWVLPTTKPADPAS